MRTKKDPRVKRHAPPRQALQHRHHARAVFVAQFRTYPLVITLRCDQDLRHGFPDGRTREAGGTHHHSEDVGVQHALYRDALGGGMEAGDAPHAVDQRRAVVGSRAPHQGAVDIE